MAVAEDLDPGGDITSAPLNQQWTEKGAERFARQGSLVGLEELETRHTLQITVETRLATPFPKPQLAMHHPCYFFLLTDLPVHLYKLR